MACSRVIVQIEEVTNSCFIVMPFHPLYEAEYERVLKPAVEEAGLVCVRGRMGTYGVRRYNECNKSLEGL